MFLNKFLNDSAFSPIGGPMCPHKKKKRFRYLGDKEVLGTIPKLLGETFQCPVSSTENNFWQWRSEDRQKNKVIWFCLTLYDFLIVLKMFCTDCRLQPKCKNKLRMSQGRLFTLVKSSRFGRQYISKWCYTRYIL